MTCTGQTALSARMMQISSVLLREEGRRFFQDFALHLQTFHPLTQFAQLTALRVRQRLCRTALDRGTHALGPRKPRAQCGLSEVQVLSDLSNASTSRLA